MNRFKDILIVILTVGIVVSSLMCWLLYQPRKKEEGVTSDSQKKVNEAVAIINRYVDSSSGRHIPIKGDKNVLPSELYKNGTAIKGGLIDTVASALEIARKQLKQVSQAVITSQARVFKAEKKADSLQRVTFLYKSKNMQITYRPPAAGTNTNDPGELNYRYNDSLNVVQYRKKSWFLGAKKSYIEIFSNDPYTTVNSVKHLVLQQKEPVFGLRVQAVGNYSFSRQLLNIGPGIQLDINHFSLIVT